MVSEQAYCGNSRNSAGSVSTSGSETGSESSGSGSYENTNYDHRPWSPRIIRHHTPGSQNSLTHLNSSWIQRLIPQQISRMEQQSLDVRQQGTDSRGSASVWTSRKMDKGQPLVPATQTKPPVFENSRRSKHNFYGSSTSSFPDTSLTNAGASSRSHEPYSSVQPELHVSPNPLPLVESLLTGDEKNFNEVRTQADTSRFHLSLSKGLDITNQVKHAVQFSPFRTLEPVQGVNSRPKLSVDGGFSFFQPKSSPSSTVAPRYSQEYANTNLRGFYMATPGTNISAQTFSVGRREYSKDTFPDNPALEAGNKGLMSDSSAHSRPLFAKPMESLRNQGTPKFPEHPWQSGINRAWGNCEKPNAFSHQNVEQTFTVSRSSQREHSAASESFSFHFGRMFSSDAENAQGAEVQWSFPTKEHGHNPTESRTSEEDINFFGQSESRCVNTWNAFTSIEKRECVGMSSVDGETLSYSISGSSKPDSLRSSIQNSGLSYRQRFDPPEKMNRSRFVTQDQRQAMSEARGFHHWSEMRSKNKTEYYKYKEQAYTYASEQRQNVLYPFKHKDLLSAESGRAGLEVNNAEFRKPEVLIPSLGKRSHDAGKAFNISISNVPFERSTPAGQPRMWLQRWLSAASKADLQNDSDFTRETVAKDKLHHIDFYEGGWRTIQGRSGISQVNYESSDQRPAKRICIDKQYPPGNPAFMKQSTSGMASQFMKRYFTPSAAAMAIIGTTARHVHATQPQKKGIFGVWRLPSKVPSLKSDFVDTCNEFETVKQTKFFPTSPEKTPPPAVDA